jgi:hypothetical protein
MIYLSFNLHMIVYLYNNTIYFSNNCDGRKCFHHKESTLIIGSLKQHLDEHNKYMNTSSQSASVASYC